MRILVTLMFLLSLFVIPFNTNSANAEALFKEQKSIERIGTIYHVYLDDVYIGDVSSKKVVNDFIKAEKKQFDTKVKMSQKITYVEERSFFKLTKDEATLKNLETVSLLENSIKFHAKGIRMDFDGEFFGYFQDEKTATEMLEAYKSQFKNVDNLITRTYFSKNVTMVEEDIDPESFTTIDDALNKMVISNNETYIVQSGDNLTKIAKNYNLTVDDILSMNNIANPNAIFIGQEISIKKEQRLLDVFVVTEKESTEEVSYQSKEVNDDTIFVGESRLQQQGVNGLSAVTMESIYKNGELVSSGYNFVKVLKEPVDEIIARGTKQHPHIGTGVFGAVVNGGYVMTSSYGMRDGEMHNGMDIVGDRAILSADNGTVTFSGWMNGYGNRVVVNHNNGYQTAYSHLASISVSVGQVVAKGQQVGIMGATGDADGVHLHLEIIRNGQFINPSEFY